MSLYKQSHPYVVPVAYYALVLPEFTMKTHAHHRCEIMYLLSGTCRIEAAGQLLQMQERQFVWIDQDVPHRLQVDAASPAHMLNLEFTCSPDTGLQHDRRGVDLTRLAARQTDFRAFLDCSQPFCHLLDSGKVGYALKDLIDELEAKAAPDALLLEVLFTRLLVEVARSGRAAGTNSGIRHVRRAVQYVVDHLYEDLSVAVVARAVGVNHSYLQKLFARHMNCGIMQYINNQRLEQAAFLLRNSNLRIIDIACHIGYNSRQHFSHIFRKQFQVRPQTYRKMHSCPLNPDTAGSQRLIDAQGGRSSVLMNGTESASVLY